MVGWHAALRTQQHKLRLSRPHAAQLVPRLLHMFWPLAANHLCLPVSIFVHKFCAGFVPASFCLAGGGSQCVPPPPPPPASPFPPWRADPTKYFERYPDADILASSDDLTPSNPKGDDGLEQLESIHSAMNIGGLRDALEGICVGPAVLWYRHACSAACTASMEWPACDKVVLPLQACSSSATPRTPPTSSTHGSSSWMPTPKWGHGGAGRMAFTCLVCTGVELLVAALLH
jgi:hypothetical protein